MNDDFKKLLKVASFGLKAFSLGLNQMAKTFDSFAENDPDVKSTEKTTDAPAPEPKAKEKAPASPRKKAKSSPRKKKKRTDTDIILDVIVNAEDGIDINALSRETGFPKRKISDTVHRLKRQEKIKTLKPGFYVKP